VLPLHLFGNTAAGERFALIATHDGRMCGFLADALIDMIDEVPTLDRSVASRGLLGIAAVAGRRVEIVDAAHYLTAASAPVPAQEQNAA
jgi:hypothetical protein